MTRGVLILAAVAGSILAPRALAQQLDQPEPCANDVAGTQGCQLIAWSHLQSPHPDPQPEPGPEPLPDAQSQHPPDTDPQAPDNSADGQLTTLTGTIMKQGSQYVLSAGNDTVYRFDDRDSDRVKTFQDKRVRIVGFVDSARGILRIQRIEPIA